PTMTQSRDNILIACEQVSWKRDGVAVLQDISFTLAPGEILTLIGPNGAGKTSLVSLVTGLAQPSSGRIWRRPKLRLGYMPQHLRFDSSLPLSVERFLRLATQDREAIERSCQRLGVT